MRRNYEIITVHLQDLNEDFRAIVGHLCILSQLLSQRSSPYTTQVTPHLIVPPRIFINPTSNCTKFINSNLESSSIVLNKYAENPFIYIYRIKYIPFIALVEFMLKRKLRSRHFNFAQLRYFILHDRSFHRRKNFINRGNS